MSDLNGEDDVYKQIEVLREMKASGVVMETNEDALKKIENYKNHYRFLYRINMDLHHIK